MARGPRSYFCFPGFSFHLGNHRENIEHENGRNKDREDHQRGEHVDRPGKLSAIGSDLVGNVPGILRAQSECGRDHHRKEHYHGEDQYRHRSISVWSKNARPWKRFHSFKHRRSETVLNDAFIGHSSALEQSTCGGGALAWLPRT
jgi:hypothetical protein